MENNETFIALVDCNNFYVSCERVFNPKLWNKPVIVLSNNDGCIIARSKEAKVLGIPMGAPFFEYRDIIKKNKVVILSSNYALYGDMSSRVMSLLEEASSDVEIYSIDEAFVSWDRKIAMDEAVLLKKRIWQLLGIPVSIGLGRSKTLAKAAVEKAKNSEGGVFLLKPEEEEIFLNQFPVKKIWGVGSALYTRLLEAGIETALLLRQADDAFIRNRFTVVLLRTVFELRGIPCFFSDDSPPQKKSITCSRSFGRYITTFEEICEAVATYASRAGEKLREEQGLASFILIFLTLHPLKQGTRTTKIIFNEPLSSTPSLIEAAKLGAKYLFEKGCVYRKAGVILGGIVDSQIRQGDLFSMDEIKKTEKWEKAIEAMDHLNQKFGKKAVAFAAEGLKKPWAMKQNSCSPRSTTRWSDIIKIKI